MKEILVFDGGLDTELAKYVGVSVKEIGDSPLWCSRYMKLNRNACVQVCRSYIRGNARKVLIAGDVGAYGASLHDGSEYHGEYIDTTPLETIKSVHKPIIDALVTAGADIIVCETVPAIPEAELMLQLLKDYVPMKVIMSFSCKDDQHISHGETLADAAERCYKVNAAQLAAVGVNCLNPKWVTPLLRSVRERLPDVGFMIRCNSGETYDTELQEWIGKDKCVPLTNYIQDWINLGANYIGGCCRTTPEDIRSFRHYIDKLKAYQS